jgi:cell division protein FtsQ
LLFRYEQFRKGETRVPYIEHYDIHTEGKNVIHIEVYEKILVGCVKVMGQYLYFDKDGYVTESSEERLPNVPLVKGLEFDRIVLYEKLKIQKDELYDVILNITKLVREYEIPAQCIIFNGKGEVELEVGDNSVSMGKRVAYDLQIQKLADILPSVSGRKLYINLSGYEGGSEDIIAKPKEE